MDIVSIGKLIYWCDFCLVSFWERKKKIILQIILVEKTFEGGMDISFV